MARVRVPKELRPPSRFEAFRDHGWCKFPGRWRCAGKFRRPKVGEWFWHPEYGGPDKYSQSVPDHVRPHVILEKVV